MDFIKKQLELFHAIQLNFRHKCNFISSMNDHLPYQKSALYKRLRGDALLSIPEMVALAKKYHLSLDELFELKKECFVFEYPAINMLSSNSAKHYVLQLKKELDDMLHLSNFSMKYQTRELPIFYYFKYPKLAFFKLFIYNNTTWKDPSAPLLKFNFLSADDELISMIKNVYQQFISLPRTEYWTSHPYNFTILQLLSTLSNQLFEEEGDALDLIDLLIQMNSDIFNLSKKHAANRHENTNYSRFELFSNEMNVQESLILIESHEYDVIYKSMLHPDFIKCSNKHLIETTKSWFLRTEDLSICLTNGNRQKMPIFFNRLNTKLIEVKSYILQQLEHDNTPSSYP